jgi:hypothetical protein
MAPLSLQHSIEFAMVAASKAAGGFFAPCFLPLEPRMRA